MLKPDELPQLTELAAEMPERRIGVIRHLWPSIQACLDAGHTVRAIQSRLADEGVPIPYSTLCWAISTLRNAPPARSTARQAGERRPSKVEAAGDPLSNLRRASQSRPGFDYSGTLSDEELFGKK